MDAAQLDLRRKYALVLRRYLSGRITNFEYNDAACDLSADSRRLGDRDPSRIYWAFWGSYCDLREYRLTGENAPSPEFRRIAARVVLFLRSDSAGCAFPRELSRCSWFELLSCLAVGGTIGLCGLALLVDGVIEFIQGWSGRGAAKAVIGGVVVAMALRMGWGALSTPLEESGPREGRSAGRPRGDEEEHLWPFASREDYERALLTAGYLGRTQAPQLA